MLAGESGAGGDEVGGCALEDDPAAVVAGARPRSMIQSACAMTAWWCSMTMTDLPASTSRSSRPSSCSTSARWRPVGRLVEDVDAALLGHAGGQLEPLPLAAGQRRERLAAAEAAKADVGEPVEDFVRGRRARLQHSRRCPHGRLQGGAVVQVAAGDGAAGPQTLDAALEADAAAGRAGAGAEVDDVVGIAIASGSCSTTSTVFPLSRSRRSRSPSQSNDSGTRYGAPSAEALATQTSMSWVRRCSVSRRR
jgi:hypothetical protein